MKLFLFLFSILNTYTIQIVTPLFIFFSFIRLSQFLNSDVKCSKIIHKCWSKRKQEKTKFGQAEFNNTYTESFCSKFKCDLIYKTSKLEKKKMGRNDTLVHKKKKLKTIEWSKLNRKYKFIYNISHFLDPILWFHFSSEHSNCSCCLF